MGVIGRAAAAGSAALLLTLGCASAGGGGSSAVPVYLAEADVPCDFQVVRAVTGRSTVTSLRDYQRVRDRELGEEAVRLGADAVLIPDEQREPGRDGVGLQLTTIGGVPQPNDVTFSGVAIRWTFDTCDTDA